MADAEIDRGRLQDLDAALAAVPLPRELPARIAASVEARGARQQRTWTLVAVASAVVLAFVLGRRTAPVDERVEIAAEVAAPVEPSREAPEPPRIAASTPVETPEADVWWSGRLRADGSCADARIEGGKVVARGACRLALAEPAMEIDVWDGATLVAAERGVRVDAGTVQFHVAPVPVGDPRARVEVGAGAIEVIGTRFVVTADGDEGHVDLLEGAIAFVDRDRRTHAVAPGKRLSWAAGAVRQTVRRPSVKVGKPSPADAVDLDAGLLRVAELRRAGRYRDAIDELVRLRRATTDESAAQTLSFEEGTLRARVDRPQTVCSFWRGHVARFGVGEHAASIDEHLAQAGCEPE